MDRYVGLEPVVSINRNTKLSWADLQARDGTRRTKSVSLRYLHLQVNTYKSKVFLQVENRHIASL